MGQSLDEKRTACSVRQVASISLLGCRLRFAPQMQTPCCSAKSSLCATSGHLVDLGWCFTPRSRLETDPLHLNWSSLSLWKRKTIRWVLNATNQMRLFRSYAKSTYLLESVVAHRASGGLESFVNGGDFFSGFATAGFFAFIGPKLEFKTVAANTPERVIGTIRRECLDHVIVVTETPLRRGLSAYVQYYNGSRTHRPLAEDLPDRRAVERSGTITVQPILGGLHYRYVRI